MALVVAQALLLTLAICCPKDLFGQFQRSNMLNKPRNPQEIDDKGNAVKKSGKDSLQHRDKFADSITIFYKYFDSARTELLDSSLNDFTKRYPVPYTSEDLGNLGTAVRPLLFTPNMKAGWDAGFHQFDAFKFTLHNTRIFQTTRPYTELGYLIGSKNEQLIDFVHTQNKKNNFNFSFEYRFSNSPGIYRNQNASQNHIRATTHYTAKDRRYESFLVYVSNKQACSEYGGLVAKSRLDSLALNNPFELDTKLGNPTSYSRNPFNTTVNTGNVYKDLNLTYRHQYDFGPTDSLVQDSVVTKLFHPRFRLQHTAQVETEQYQYIDLSASDSLYSLYFGKAIASDTISYKDRAVRWSNEVAIVTFPDKDNIAQFFKTGATFLQSKVISNDSGKTVFNDISLLAEYRNRSRNKLWDIIASGTLFVNGAHAGDYSGFVSMKRVIGTGLGSLQIGGQTVNRSPSHLFSGNTGFAIDPHETFNKENTTKLFGYYENPGIGVSVGADYFLVGNYLFGDGYFSLRQDRNIFNVIRARASKTFRLSKHWNYYLEMHLQQTTGGAPVNLPWMVCRQRLAYEGNFFKNLFLSTGVEARYIPAYNAPDYSPFTGQFFYQRDRALSNRPDVNLFFHFRIRSFKAFVRLENLNTVAPEKNFAFTHYNFRLNEYPGMGRWTRVGIWWTFIN